MKRTIFILALLFVLAATPALAKPGNEKANENAKNKQVLGIEVSPTGTELTPTTEPCGPNEVYKNHGAYVSCVAKTHPGGQTVSAAAKSDIGKKKSPSGTPSPSVSPSISPSVTITPTATPSVSPTITPTGEPTGTETAETNNLEENTNLGQQIQGLIDKLNELIEMLKSLATN